MRKREPDSPAVPEVMASSSNDSGSDLAGTPLLDMLMDLREHARDLALGHGDGLGKRAGHQDTALDLFQSAASEQGIGITEYLKEAGIMYGGQEKKIRRWEVPFEDEYYEDDE